MKNTILFLLVCAFLSSCATSGNGYNYKSHHKKSANAKPSKCYTKHNKW